MIGKIFRNTTNGFVWWFFANNQIFPFLFYLFLLWSFQLNSLEKIEKISINFPQVLRMLCRESPCSMHLSTFIGSLRAFLISALTFLFLYMFISETQLFVYDIRFNFGYQREDDRQQIYLSVIGRFFFVTLFEK